MSERIVYQCDGCGKRTDDYLAEYNWLIIEGHIYSLSITHGRGDTKSAIAKWRSCSGKRLLMFCRPFCLRDFCCGAGS